MPDRPSEVEPTAEQIEACMSEARNLACITRPLIATKAIARVLADLITHC